MIKKKLLIISISFIIIIVIGITLYLTKSNFFINKNNQQAGIGAPQITNQTKSAPSDVNNMPTSLK